MFTVGPPRDVTDWFYVFAACVRAYPCAYVHVPHPRARRSSSRVPGRARKLQLQLRADRGRAVIERQHRATMLLDQT